MIPGPPDLPPPPPELWDVECYNSPEVEREAPLPAGDPQDGPASMPGAIQLAILFGCVDVAVGGVDLVVTHHVRVAGDMTEPLAWFVFGALLTGAILYLIATGREWARLALVNLWLVMAMLEVPGVVEAIGDSSAAGTKGLLLLMLRAAAIALLFLPANRAWWSGARAARAAEGAR